MGRSRIPRPLVLLAALLATTALARGTLGAEGSRPRANGGPGLEGRVRGASGLPIAGARVVAWRVNHETRARPVEVGATRSDAKGAFHLRRLGTGTFEIEIEAPGYQPGRIGVHLPEGSTSLFPLEVSLAPVRPAPRARAAESEPAPEREPPPGAAADAVPTTATPSPTAPAAGASEARAHESDAAGSPSAPNPPSAPSAPALPREPTAGAAQGDVGATILEARRAIEGGHLRRAQALLAAVDAVRPEDADVFYAVGEGLLRAGEAAEAVAFLGKALARDPSHVEAHYRLALGLLALGRNAEAKAEFEKVLELRTDGPLAEGARRALGELEASPKGE
jgi:hypothetical protein